MKQRALDVIWTAFLLCSLGTSALAGCGGTTVPATAGSGGGLGTGGSTSSAGGAGGGSNPADALPACPPEGAEPAPGDLVAGIYSVPVSPDLEPFASYPVADIELCRTAAGVHLGYTLPELLVGKANHVSFEGGFDAALGTFELAGSEGTASCAPAGSWTCAEAFTDMAVDLDAVAKAAEGLGPTEAAARLEVAKRFSVDPIGKLDFAAP